MSDLFWRYERGYGHACNRVITSEFFQKHGWLTPIDGVSNASFNDVVCENLGDDRLPEVQRNIRLIIAAPDLLAACKEQLDQTIWLTCEEFHARRGRLEAAIRKAEGDSNE